MHERLRESSMSRRRLLAGVAAGTVVLAGCSEAEDGTPADGGASDGDGEGVDTVTPEENLTSGPNPTPTVSDGELPAPVKGDPDADVTLAVYEDYACPHCVDYNVEGLPELESEYIEPGDIRYEHHDLPIPVADPGSWQAASAARDAQARQGSDGFYAYASALFRNGDELRSDVESLFERLGNDLGFDGEAISTAGVNRAHDRTVEADRKSGVDAGVEGTPGFVVNGDVITTGFGSDTLSTVRDALDEELSETA